MAYEFVGVYYEFTEYLTMIARDILYDISGQTPKAFNTVRPMNRECTIHASWVKELFYYAIEKGASRNELIEKTGLNSLDFDDPDARIPVKKLVRLWHASVELTGNPALALQLGSSTNPVNAGILYLVCMNAPDLQEMFERLTRYMHLFSESDSHALIEESDCAKYIYRIEVPEAFTVYAIERTMAMALRWFSAFSGLDIEPLSIEFQYHQPEYRDEYDKVFSCPLIFGQANNAITFSKEILKTPARTYNAYLDELVQKQANKLLLELSPDNNIEKKTQNLILRELPAGRVNVDVIADKLHMSRRTLARKLKEENTTFQDLLENIRKNLATDYLKQEKFCINDIAFLLGFSESSAFSRAFKRWFDYSPQEYRESLWK